MRLVINKTANGRKDSSQRMSISHDAEAFFSYFTNHIFDLLLVITEEDNRDLYLQDGNATSTAMFTINIKTLKKTHINV